MNKEEFVLYTSDNKYIVEYLFKELRLTSSISEAKIFNNITIALSFKEMLQKECNLECSVNTYIG